MNEPNNAISVAVLQDLHRPSLKLSEEQVYLRDQWALKRLRFLCQTVDSTQGSSTGASKPFDIAKATLDKDAAKNIWHQVVQEYHQGGWRNVVATDDSENQQRLSAKLIQDEAIATHARRYGESDSGTGPRELFGYVWTLVQTALIVKSIVYYFGLEASNDPSAASYGLLFAAVIFSFGSLFFFAWRKTRR